MDILAGMLAYVAGIGALLAGLAVSFFVFFSTPHGPRQTESQQQSASAMLVRPSAQNKAAAVETHAKHSATRSTGYSEKQVTAAVLLGSTQAAASARDSRGGKHAASAAQARRLVQEERARGWAYQQDSGFESRFLGYVE